MTADSAAAAVVILSGPPVAVAFWCLALALAAALIGLACGKER